MDINMAILLVNYLISDFSNFFGKQRKMVICNKAYNNSFASMVFPNVYANDFRMYNISTCDD